MGSCASVVRGKNTKYPGFIENKKYNNNNQDVKIGKGSSNVIDNTTHKYK
jgi:hypothetical protein